MLNQRIHLKAVEDIPRYGCITSYGTLADSGDPASENHIVGVTEGVIRAGVWGDATVAGLLFDQDWTWTPGEAIYLNGTVLSHTAPGIGFIQQIGLALTSQRVFINIQSSGGGSAGGTKFYTTGSLGGLSPPEDGSVTTEGFWDLDTDFAWVNIGSIAAPIWKPH